MPFNVDSPMDLAYTPARYPTPDWSKLAEVTEVVIPEQKPAGWLVIQDDMALSWLSSAGYDRPAAYAVRTIVEETLTLALQEGRTCREAHNLVQSKVLVGPPQLMDLRKLSERLQKDWS